MSIVLRQCVLIDKRVSLKKLIALEERVVKNFAEFMNQDISSIIISLTKLGLMPLLVVSKLKEQDKMTFFNINETLKLMECIIEYLGDKRIDELPIFADLFEKLTENLCLKVDKMTEPKLTQTMKMFDKLLEIFVVLKELEEMDMKIIDVEFYQACIQLLLDQFTIIMGEDEFKFTVTDTINSV